ncbi:MarR family transcriptional regulator [Microcoleus sp. herbarium14]|uniref:MarR family winged helix-turn-helix transcriptional regulator n=1 Tax=Microcoleus sp. herbarium14 TaxID=3055439 RepID=UPI002FD1AFD0
MTAKPKLDNLRNSVWRLFITANVKLFDRIGEKFSQAGLPSMDWYDVLLTLKEAPEYRVRLSDLAEKVLLSRSNLTHLVDRLEKAGLLYRERCPIDRRGTYAVLTEAGLAMQQQMWTVYAEGIAEYFACHLDDEELQVMQRVLKRMLATASQ